jgi:hypothetical protein
MGQNMSNIYFAAIKVNGGDQPVFVAANIENNPMIQLISRRECGSQISKVVKLRSLHNLEPANQGRSAIGMFLPKLGQGFSSNDMHKPIISQFEIRRKSK